MNPAWRNVRCGGADGERSRLADCTPEQEWSVDVGNCKADQANGGRKKKKSSVRVGPFVDTKVKHRATVARHCATATPALGLCLGILNSEHTFSSLLSLFLLQCRSSVSLVCVNKLYFHHRFFPRRFSLFWPTVFAGLLQDPSMVFIAVYSLIDSRRQFMQYMAFGSKPRLIL
jgi:hypothetical protein